MTVKMSAMTKMLNILFYQSIGVNCDHIPAANELNNSVFLMHHCSENVYIFLNQTYFKALCGGLMLNASLMLLF